MGLEGLAFTRRDTGIAKVVVFEEKPAQIHFRQNRAEPDTAMWVTVEYCCSQCIDRVIGMLGIAFVSQVSQMDCTLLFRLVIKS